MTTGMFSKPRSNTVARRSLKTIHKMMSESNPILLSWLSSFIDYKTGETILHLALNQSKVKGHALHLQDELKWFETVRRIVPKELLNHRRNSDNKTAQELFTEKHEVTLDNCKTQLIGVGQKCSALVAAVVFASSFSIPGENDQNTGKPLYFHRLPFKIFSHAYVIGFACAATSLVLFLSLIIAPYEQRDFRRAVPMKYFFAWLSFSMALLVFLISITCNVYLKIYSGQGKETKELIPLILELTVFPAVCFVVLLYNGAKFGPSFSRLWTSYEIATNEN